MKISSVLTFGKYKGRTIEEIWCGEIPLNTKEVVETYVKELCHFIFNNDGLQKIPASSVKLSIDSNEISFLNQSFSERKIRFNGNEIIVDAKNEMISLAFFDILSKIFSGSYLGFSKYYFKGDVNLNLKCSKNSAHFQFLQADPQYLKWCIENVENFVIDKDEFSILILKPCRYFNKFKLEKISNNICSYQYKFINLEYVMPEEVLKLNKNKSIKTLTTDKITFCEESQNESSAYCESCQESPCMCSDREQSSSVYDY